ncbi:MAG: PAS domain-containing protein, partial [Thermomicrobiales bacterium]|nr:PAS domain-containing protein [Thermomicrobiales bacterium]
LQRRMAATGTATLAEYQRYTEAHPAELQRLVASFLIKVTDFFRDPELFAYLREHVLPQAIAEARGRGELRLWSAGCATGEEAYSLAMLVAELLDEEEVSLHVRIFATDIAADAVEFARRGLYPASALSGLSPETIERHFLPVDGAFEVRKAVRATIVFGEHDLGHRAPFPRIDLVLCRNVLIYFTPELQRRALHLFAFSLRQGGWLVLGKAETVNPLPEFFALDQPRLKVYRRVGEASPIPPNRVFDIATSTMSARPTRRVIGRGENLAAGTTGRDLALALQVNRLVEGLPVGVVTVDRNYHIRSINGADRRLLEIHAVALGDDLIHQAPVAIAGALRAALDDAFRGRVHRAQHQLTGDPLDDDGRDLTVTTYPAGSETPGSEVTAVVVVVEDGSPAARRQRELEAERDRTAAELVRAETRATQAVTNLRELRAANQALAASNARLRADHDELLVASEEAQAAAEEIETLNEELQATNEELETLNEELQATVEELTTTNHELLARTEELDTRTSELRTRTGELDARTGELDARTGELATMTEAVETERAGRRDDWQRLLEALMQASAAIIVVEGPERMVRLANEPAAALRSEPGAEVLGRPLAEAFPELQQQGVGALLERADASGQTVSDEIHVRLDRAPDAAPVAIALNTIAMPLHDPGWQHGGAIILATANGEEPSG